MSNGPAPSTAFGPQVSLNGDYFFVEGRRFPRRRFAASAPIQPVRRKSEGLGWDSQFTGLPTAEELRRDVPAESEIFTYLSPTMAAVLRRIAEVESQDRQGFVLLLGPTGCGKTSLAKTYCFLANQPCTELSFSGDTALSDFFTAVELVRDDHTRQSTLTVPGPAVEAMLRGKKLIVNEINMLPPDLLTVFAQAMDTGRVILSGTERGNVEVEVHADFGLIATANPNYVGTVELGRAMERRFGRGLGVIEMDYLPPEEEAEAIRHELAREPLFAEHEITFPAEICLEVARLAAWLRGDDRVGDLMRSRVSTRTLVNWLGLSQITGLPLATVFTRAFLGTVPSEARAQALRLTMEALGDRRLGSDGSTRLAAVRIRWPTVRVGEAVPLSAVQPPRSRSRNERANLLRSTSRPVIHRVRFVRALPDGGKVLIAEPLHADATSRRFGLGLRIRAYDAAGRQIIDPQRIAEIRRLLKDDDGLNVLQPLGRRVDDRELLPCLTSHAVEVLELAEAALLLGRPVFLAGPTGAGKSSIARTLAKLRGSSVVELGFTGETAKTDLSAVRRLIGGVTAWQTQAFLQAVESGDTVIANEYNLAYPDVHSLLNGLFDKGARFVLPDGRICRMHPRARVIGTGLLDGPGVKPLNEAVENRFGAIIGVEYPPVEDEVAIIRYVAPGLAAETVTRCVRLVDYCRRLVVGKVDPANLADLSRPAQQALRQAARRAALSTAELVALARFASGADFAERLREGILDGAPDSVQRVLEPVLLQYGLS